MHICSIITSFGCGGAETLVCNLGARFVKLGHRATVIALSDARAVGNCSSTERRIVHRAQEDGLGVVSLGLTNRRNIVGGARALRRAFAAGAPDVIHAHTAGALPMLWLAARHTPVVLTHHNSRLGFPRTFFRFFDRTVGSYVAISEECAQLFRSLARKPVRTIINAPGPEFVADKPRRLRNETPVMLSVGNLTDQKNYACLIRAARLLEQALRSRGGSFRLKIAGHGALRNSLQESIEAEGLGHCVELLGARTDVPSLMREADVYVNSSHYEGLPIAVLEALASALPVIATNVPGNRELVRDGHNGRLVAPDDPRDIADALFAIITDPEAYRRCSAGALQTARQFSIERCAEEHLRLYGEFTHSSGHGLRSEDHLPGPSFSPIMFRTTDRSRPKASAYREPHL